MGTLARLNADGTTETVADVAAIEASDDPDGGPPGPPEPPPSGELRRVNRRYRCDVCGVELKLTMAPDEDPPPPKHCLEDMTGVAPLYD